MSRSRPTTPIRRVSRGSISSHHRTSVSNATPSAATPLTFLTQAMSDLAYETSTLHSNLECVEEIDNALLTFDESFSMFLYGLRMNAFCVEWPEAPGEENFDRHEERKEQRKGGRKSVTTGGASYGIPGAEDVTVTLDTPHVGSAADQTYMTQEDDDAELLQRRPINTASANVKAPLKSALKKPSAAPNTAAIKAVSKPAMGSAPPKGRITAAEKKKRESKAAGIIETLPLEYRGTDPKSTQLAKSVLLALIAGGDKGIRIAEIAKMPELPPAKVNKCLIALVAAKHVIKRSDNGALYQLDSARHGA